MIKSSLTPPTVDQATVDLYVAKGRRERARAVVAFFRALFGSNDTYKTNVRQVTRSKVSTA
ncbi:MAG: hypothetical protein AB8B85_05030 [Paracoccaceae bacterium]